MEYGLGHAGVVPGIRVPVPEQPPVPAVPVDAGRHGPPPTVELDNCTEKMATSSRATTTATPRLPSPPSSFNICLLLPLLLPLRECDEPHCRPSDVLRSSLRCSHGSRSGFGNGA